MLLTLTIVIMLCILGFKAIIFLLIARTLEKLLINPDVRHQKTARKIGETIGAALGRLANACPPIGNMLARVIK